MAHPHAPYGVQHPQTTQHASHAVGKSFDFNKYRKDQQIGGIKQQGVNNIMPHHTNAGFSSP